MCIYTKCTVNNIINYEMNIVVENMCVIFVLAQLIPAASHSTAELNFLQGVLTLYTTWHKEGNASST